MTLETRDNRYCIRHWRRAVCLLGILYLASAGHIQAQSMEEDWSEILVGELLASNDLTQSVVQMIAEPNNQSLSVDTPEVTNSPEKDDPLVIRSPRTVVERELWKARIETLPESEISEPKDDLEKIIQQVNSIEFKQQIVSSTSAGEAESDAEQTQQTVSENQDDQDQPNVQAEEEYPKIVSEQMLTRFTQLSKSPESMINPLELADILFKRNYLKESAVCYREALRRLNDGQSDVFEDEAWILFQLGNCLKETDPQAALENYQMVVAEFPYSSWAQLAKEKGDYVSWYLKDNPGKLMDESRAAIAQ